MRRSFSSERLGRVRSISIENPSQWATAARLQVAAVAALVVILHVPLGDYMASVYADTRHWRLEKVLYRLIGAEPDDGQRWMKYSTSVLAFSAVSVLLLYGLLLAQTRLPEPWGHRGMTPALAFNTAISFVTDTSWQNYPGEPHSDTSGCWPDWAFRRSPAARSECVSLWR